MNVKKVKILATEYDINETEHINNYERLLGEIDYEKQIIKIEKTLSEDLKQETLIHEIFHGVLDKLGYNEINEDEQKVQSISSTLYQVLKDSKLISSF